MRTHDLREINMVHLATADLERQLIASTFDGIALKHVSPPCCPLKVTVSPAQVGSDH